MTLVFSKTAHANLVSFWAGIFGDQSVSANTAPLSGASLNSQTMSLLQAPSNPDSSSNIPASDTPPIDGGNVLSPDMAAANGAASIQPLNTQISTYIVRQGDNVYSIAKMFNVSVNTVLWANDLTTHSVLQAGQTLVILPVTGITYSIKSKDTIQGIAKKYGADVNDILNYNDITLSSTLAIGDQILIPAGEMPAATHVTSVSSGKVPNEPLLDASWNWPIFPGYYVCPVPGARLSQGLHGHNAVDLAIARGTPIHAAAAGTVIISRANGAWNGGYGNFVVIMHGNSTQTLYAHMSRSTVSAGKQVSQGDVIGYVGMTGLTTGPHVHFEIRGAQNPFTDPALCW